MTLTYVHIKNFSYAICHFTRSPFIHLILKEEKKLKNKKFVATSMLTRKQQNNK